MSTRTALSVLILGGYGTFGGRLARLLAGNAGVTLLIAGRHLERAQSFCNRLAPGAARQAIRFDRNEDALVRLRDINPDWVVDASGPFQCYGEDPYRIIKACLILGIDYLDLADSVEFVKGVAQFDCDARERGVVILSGVSSFPVLSAAAVRHLARGLTNVDSITGGIAPSPYAGVGANVIRAVASYTGKRLALTRGGRPSFGVAMTESRRYTVSPPGHLPLRNLRFSLVDVPDLQVLPQSWPRLESVWMGAGPVPEILHRMLNGLAWLVRWRLLPSLMALAPLIYFVSNRVRWGEHRGGMFIEISGDVTGGVAVTRSWHLLAEGDDGPLIPSMACQALIERTLAGCRPQPGARPATNDLELRDYEALFARRTIYTGTRGSESDAQQRPLFRQILGDAWQALPEALRAMHDVAGKRVAMGQADIERGRNPLALLVAWAARFPAAGRRVPLELEFTCNADGERWERTFAGRSFTSVQSAGHGRSAHLLVERFGPLRFSLALVVDRTKLRFIVRRWSLWGLPLPTFLAPGGETYETVVDDRFHFNVEIRHRFIGLIVAYRGWLEAPVATESRAPRGAREACNALARGRLNNTR